MPFPKCDTFRAFDAAFGPSAACHYVHEIGQRNMDVPWKLFWRAKKASRVTQWSIIWLYSPTEQQNIRFHFGLSYEVVITRLT